MFGEYRLKPKTRDFADAVIEFDFKDTDLYKSEYVIYALLDFNQEDLEQVLLDIEDIRKESEEEIGLVTSKSVISESIKDHEEFVTGFIEPGILVVKNYMIINHLAFNEEYDATISKAEYDLAFDTIWTMANMMIKHEELFEEYDVETISDMEDTIRSYDTSSLK